MGRAQAQLGVENEVQKGLEGSVSSTQCQDWRPVCLRQTQVKAAGSLVSKF